MITVRIITSQMQEQCAYAIVVINDAMDKVILQDQNKVKAQNWLRRYGGRPTRELAQTRRARSSNIASRHLNYWRILSATMSAKQQEKAVRKSHVAGSRHLARVSQNTAVRRPGRWDLSELVEDHTDAKFEEQVRNVKRKAESFERVKKRLQAKMPEADFHKILHKIEKIKEELSIVTHYAALLYASDTQSDQATSLLTRMRKLSADISNRLLFFELWWKMTVDDENATRLMQSAGDLAEYLRHQRLTARYTLSESEERIINILDVTGVSALVKLYNKITNAFEYRVKVGGRIRAMNREQLIGLVRSTDPKVRKAAYVALLGKFATERGVLGEIYQNVVLKWRDEGMQLRGYSTPISVRNMENGIDDSTVDALLHTCRNNTRIFQKFFWQKARMLHRKRLRRYDIYAPIDVDAKERRYSYDRSARLILKAMDSFSPKMADFARKVLDQNHIDAELRRGKTDGAFCSTISPKITPFVLVNFTGRTRDVFTMAHELGHAVHSQAAAGRSILVQEASLPLAETASTFSELLLYDSLVEKMPEEEWAVTLAEKIDDLYATIMRQSFFTLFEINVHEQIASGTTVDEISRYYLKNLEEQFGSAVELSDDFAVEWSAIPHFYYSPFYCYAYAFGNLLALSLFQRYKKEGTDFASTYISILSAGGSQKPEPLLSQYGIDVTSSRFWQEGFDYVNQQVGRLTGKG